MSHSPDRRDFIRSSVVALGALGAAGCASASRTKAWVHDPLLHGIAPEPLARPPHQGRIRVGLVGFGVRGREVYGGFLADEQVDIVAVCDVVEARAKEGQRRVDERRGAGTCAIARNWREIVADRAIDAVVVTTPDHQHAEPSIAAALAGIHVYCDKPLSLTISEGRAIAAAAHTGRICFQTGSQQRSEYAHNFVRAAEAVRNGRIGHVQRVTVHTGNPPVPCDLPEEPLPAGIDWDGWLGQAPMRGFNKVLCPEGMHGHYPDWRRFREYCNGGLADMGAHHFDIVQWALGMDASGPRKVIPPAEAGATRGLRLVYANGTELVHGGPTDCTFEGEFGTIECSRGHIKAYHGTDRNAPDAPELLAEPREGEVRLPRNRNHIADFLDAIREGRDPVCTAEIGHRTATVCQLAVIGYQLGKPLTWDPVAEAFIGEHAEEANALRSLPVRRHG